MKLLHIDEPASHHSREILDYNYTRSVKDLLGGWRLVLEGTRAEPFPFVLGDTMTLPGLAGQGIITSIQRGEYGQFLLTGQDNGLKLSKTLPEESFLREGDVDTAIQHICEYCGIEVVGACNLNVPASGLITGTTCIEAVQELAMLSGKITYIDNQGRLVIARPSLTAPAFDTILSEESYKIDTDSYATGCTVIVQRRKKSNAEKTGGVKIAWFGSTPSGMLDVVTYDGTNTFENGHVTYEVEIYMPINAPKRTAYTIIDGTVSKTYISEYTYDVDSDVEVRGDREYRVWQWAMLTEIITTDITGVLTVADGSTIATSEHTVKTTTRSYDLDGNLISEVAESVTSKNSDANTIGFIPPAPPFDYRVERKYETLGLGASKLMTEIEERYDKQAITRLVPVIDGTTDERISQTLPSGTRFVLLPQSYTDEWVLVTTTKTVHEIFEDDTCVARMTSSHSDKGGAFLLKHGYVIPADIEDIGIGESEKAYTALDTLSDRTNIEFLPGSSSLAGDRQTLEQEGRQKVYITTEGNTNVNGDEWYFEGDYVPSRICPHYSNSTCRMAALEILNPTFSGNKCPYHGVGWRSCERAVAALERARSDESDNKLLEAPVICAVGSGDLWISREIYLDTDDLTEEQATSVGTIIATNILAAKAGLRGAIRTIVVPLNAALMPTGAIISVQHDWQAMHTTLEIRQNMEIPSILLPNTVSGAATIVAAREWRRQQRGYIGKVVSIDDDNIINVLVANRGIKCRTRLKYVVAGDSVLIALPAGNGSYGIVMERL